MKEKLKMIDKKLWILLGAFLVIIILGLGISKIIYLVGNSNKSYSEVESILKDAGIEYYKDNTSSLPSEDGDSVSVGDTVLADEGYMKSLDKLIKEGTCTGKVTVTKEKDIYNYAAYLDCGKSYKTTEFYKKLLKNVVTSGDGLYQDGTGYSFRGDNPNNYLSIDDKIWRIVSLRDDNTMEIVNTIPINYITWDDRYNSEDNYKAGYNNFANSRLNDSLDNIYKEKLFYEDDSLVITKSIKNSLVAVNNCIDKVSETTTDFSNCTNKNDKFVSVINIGEYIKASLDSKCSSPANKECQNYNYLSVKEDYWTLTGNSESTSEVYLINSGGAIESETANGMEAIYPVVRLADSMMYVSGEGTIDKPYVIR